MRKFIFKHTCYNHSNYDIDLVWENAQDLEHVACLHGKTNYTFQLVNVIKDQNNNFLYDSLSFIVVRKLLGFIPITTFGFRKIISKYEIHQLEISPFIGVTTFLNSRVSISTNSNFKTQMIDTLTISIPFVFKPLRNILQSILNRHTKIQCFEDESFRQRRQLLLEKGIKLPLRFFNTSLYENFLNNKYESN